MDNSTDPTSTPRTHGRFLTAYGKDNLFVLGEITLLLILLGVAFVRGHHPSSLTERVYFSAGVNALLIFMMAFYVRLRWIPIIALIIAAAYYGLFSVLK